MKNLYPPPLPPKKSGMGKWRVLTFARLRLWFTCRGNWGLLFQSFCPRLSVLQRQNHATTLMKHFLWCFHLFVFLELIVYKSDLPLDEWTCDAFVSSNGSHLEIVWETQGPFKELTWSKNWNSRSHIYVVSQITVENSSQPKTCGTKWKSLSKQIEFFF